MKQRELLIISIIIFLTVVAWIIADLVHVSSLTQVKIENPQLTSKISVTVDTEIIDSLSSRQP